MPIPWDPMDGRMTAIRKSPVPPDPRMAEVSRWNASMRHHSTTWRRGRGEEIAWNPIQVWDTMYIYIYPMGGRFTGNFRPVGVYIYIYIWSYYMVDATQVMGWGGDDNVPCTCTHGRCYATSCFLALAHMVGATQHHVSCTCTHGWCYATSCFLALAHMVGASQHHVSCTCTHGRCYATSWGGVGWGW